MATLCDQEFKLKNFWFHHKRPILFVTPQCGPQALYPAWTVVHLIYHIIALGVDGAQTSTPSREPSGSYFLYIHNWTYLLLVLSSVIDCSVTLYVHCLAKYMLDERENKKAEAEIVMRNKAVKISYKTMGKYYRMRGYLKVSWAFFTISSVTGITVTFLYWLVHFLSLGLNYGYSLNGSRLEENTVAYGTLAFSFINTIVILINLTITAKPFRLLHFYMPVSFFAVYIIFNVVYQKVSGEYIYKVMDWNQVFFTTGISHGIVFIIVPLVHLLVYGLVHLRIKVGTWCLIKYAHSKWRKNKIVAQEPELDSDTNVQRWIESNEKENTKTISTGIGVSDITFPGRADRAQSTTSSISCHSETSL